MKLKNNFSLNHGWPQWQRKFRARKEKQVEGYLSVRTQNKKHGIYRVNGGKE